MTAHSRPGEVTLILAAAALVILPSVVFVAARAWLPSEGVVIDLEPPPGTSSLILRPLNPGSTGLRNGDLLLELEGRSVDAWLAHAVSLSPPTDLTEVSALTFTVERQGAQHELRVPLGPYPLWDAFLENWSTYLYLIYLEAISVLVFLRRPTLPAARILLLLSSAILGSGTIFFLGLQPSDLLRVWTLGLWFWGSVILYGFLSASLVHFALVFPRRRAILQERPWIEAVLYLAVWLPALAFVLVQWRTTPTPSARLLLVAQGAGAMTATYFPLYLITAVHGYRRTFNRKERRQVRWVLWGALVAIVPWLLLNVLPQLAGLPIYLDMRWIGILWWLIPTTFAIAILREKLFDIDVLINKSLVYGTLTAVLGLIYLGSVLVLQQLLSGESQITVVASTLVTAALFAPLRGEIQSVIDRRFYRRKYDTEQILAAFSSSMRDQVDVDDLAQTLLTVVGESVHPKTISLWVRTPRNQAGQAEESQERA